MKKIAINVLTVGMISLGLVACSTSTHEAEVENITDGKFAAQRSYDSGVQTAGINDNNNFAGRDNLEDDDFDLQNPNGIQMTTNSNENKNIIYFRFDNNSVDPEYMSIVQTNADYLKKHPSAKVRLEGNTDPRGSREYNVGLGQRRANQVEERLELLGVPKSQIVTVSYGQEKPAMLGDNDEAYRLDRRVEFIYEES